MKTILVNIENTPKEDTEALEQFLTFGDFPHEGLTKDEVIGLINLINYVIDNRKVDNASNLSYTELLELKNKLQR